MSNLLTSPIRPRGDTVAKTPSHRLVYNGGRSKKGGRMLPFSEACERNKEPILEVLRVCFADRLQVLEIGSGTGQHAVYFAARLAHLVWHPTERLGFLPDLMAR